MDAVVTKMQLMVRGHHGRGEQGLLSLTLEQTTGKARTGIISESTSPHSDRGCGTSWPTGGS